MPSFTDVFGGQNVFPAKLTLLQLNPQTTDITLAWPTEQAIPGLNVFADIIESTPNAGLSLIMPDARRASNGQATLVNNLGANTLTVKDNTGGTIGSVPSGQVWQFYLDANTTQAGVWKTFQFGTGASSATAAALAGPGLKAAGAVLEERMALTTTAATPFTLLDADRARMIVWTGGVGVINLPAPGTVGNDWFIWLRNSGTGNWTVTPPSGTIDGAATKVFAPTQSAVVICDGTNFYTVGFGQTNTGFFDHISINVAGTGDYTLTSGANELNRISYTLTGVLTGNRNIIVPTTPQQYWVFNNTSGAFTLTVKTLAGSGIVVPQGVSMILACDGNNVIAGEGVAATGLIPVTIGGTGLSSFAQGDIIYASAANVLSALAKNVSVSRVLTNQGGSNNPTWAQVDLTTGVTNRLPFTNIAQIPGLSVVGNPANVGADITTFAAAADGNVLNRAGAALVFGAITLTNPNTVTGAAQGDLLYGSAANQWSALAKDTGTYQVLTNQGTSNNPAWQRPRFVYGSAANSDYTFVLNDAWTWTPHTGAATQNWTVPANASVAFPIGTMLGIANDLAGGALTIKAADGVTIDGHGNFVAASGAAATFMVLPPGYKMILVKQGTNVWIAITDAPPTGTAVGAVYAGYVGADGSTGNRLPSGWSATKNSTGNYTVTHNLGLADLTRLAVGLSCIGTAGNKAAQQRSTGTGNTFIVETVDSGTGTLTDEAFSFVASPT